MAHQGHDLRFLQVRLGSLLVSVVQERVFRLKTIRADVFRVTHGQTTRAQTSLAAGRFHEKDVSEPSGTAQLSRTILISLDRPRSTNRPSPPPTRVKRCQRLSSKKSINSITAREVRSESTTPGYGCRRILEAFSRPLRRVSCNISFKNHRNSDPAIIAHRSNDTTVMLLLLLAERGRKPR